MSWRVKASRAYCANQSSWRRKWRVMERKAASGSELVQRLNDMVAELVKINRKLKREVEKLAARRPAAARSTVKRSSRAAPRRVQRVAKKPVAAKRRKTTAAPKAKRKTVAPRRRKATR
jgi:hypothetical protein